MPLDRRWSGIIHERARLREARSDGRKSGHVESKLGEELDEEGELHKLTASWRRGRGRWRRVRRSRVRSRARWRTPRRSGRARYTRRGYYSFRSGRGKRDSGHKGYGR